MDFFLCFMAGVIVALVLMTHVAKRCNKYLDEAHRELVEARRVLDRAVENNKKALALLKEAGR